MALGILDAKNTNADDASLIIFSSISFFTAPLFFLIGCGALLAGRNDLDRTHRIRVTIGAIIYLLSPCLSFLYLIIADGNYEFFFIGFAVINSIIIGILALANYLITCHLTEEFYFIKGKRITRKIIRYSSLGLIVSILIYVIASAVIIHNIGSKDIDYIDDAFDHTLDLYALVTFLGSFYFFWIAVAFLSIFIGISRNNMNEEVLNMGRAAYYEELYRRELESWNRYQQQYGIDNEQNGYEEVEVAEVLS
ncbi:MAG: hypothetical protein R6V01_08445 [Thermoplasmatota archaeon]